MKASSSLVGAFRVDIQALRGLAVLMVVLQHARVPYLPGGFLGVDIFFAISGYLITGLIVDAVDTHRFSFRDFYARRIRRLLPAAYATICVTAAAAPFLLDGFEYSKFVEQVIGAFTFSINFVLWRQIDYFDSGAGLKPLLHMWSLAVEEQYYLALPVALWMCPKRWRLGVCFLLSVLSAALCFTVLPRSPSAVFYFLPFRAWELGVGSVVALLVRGGFALPASTRLLSLLRLFCAVALAVTPVFASERQHPGLPALIMTLATGVILMTGSALPAGGTLPSVLRPWVWMGDRSYSLYLVHWPIFAFSNNVFLGPVPPSVRALLFVACLILAEVLYRCVERPMRKTSITVSSLAGLVMVPLITIGGSIAWARTIPPTVLEDRGWNKGFDDACAMRDVYIARSECQIGPRPDMLVWGDSYAMHLVDGVAATTTNGVVQATRTTCGPFLDIAPFNGALYSRAWAESCIAFNRSVLEAAVAHPEIKTVVLSSVLAQYVPGAEPGHWRALRSSNGSYLAGEQDTKVLLESLRLTVQALRAHGKRVVLVAPPPSGEFNIGRCLDRLGAHQWTIGTQLDCQIDRAAYVQTHAGILALVAEVEKREIVPVFRLDPVLCDDKVCRTRIEGRALYFDKGHMTRFGSGTLGRELTLAKKLESLAR